MFALQQLQTLKLGYVHVTAADAADANLPSLRELQLNDCGAHAAAVAVTLAAAAPVLELLRVICVPCTELDGTAGPGISALSALSHDTLRKLSMSANTAPFPRTARGAAAKKSAEVKASKALAAVVKALAARKALPALRSLFLGSGYDQPMPPCFVTSRPWPLLRSLTIYSATPDSIPACLAALRAPALTDLTLPGICSGVTDMKSVIFKPTKGVMAAYEALRLSGQSPMLPPLRKKSAGDGA